MAGQIFAYITHKTGKAELATAAGKIYSDVSMTAIVTGTGADLDAVCNEVANSYKEVWKFDHDLLTYPNAEAIRKLLVAVLPQDAILLAAHDISTVSSMTMTEADPIAVFHLRKLS